MSGIHPPESWERQRKLDLAVLEMYQQLCEELGSTPNYGGGRGGLDQKFWNEHHRNLEGRRKEQENRRKRSK